MSFPYIRKTVALVTTTSAYAAGEVIGTGVNEVTGLSPGMFIQSVTITCKSCNTAQMDFIPFRSSMPNTTFTDNTAIAVSTADAFNVMSPIHVSDWTSLGTPYVGTANGLAYEYVVPSDASPKLYFALVTRGTPTFGSSADVQVAITFVS